MRKRQAMDSVVLESVRTDVNSTLVLFRTIHGTLNSVFSRVGSLSDTLRQNTTLLDDCAQVEQSLSSLQHRFNGNEHNACSINGTTAPTTLSPTRIAACKTTVTASNHHEPGLSESINITFGDKASARRNQSPQQETHHNDTCFKDGFGSKICALCLRIILFKREITRLVFWTTRNSDKHYQAH